MSDQTPRPSWDAPAQPHQPAHAAPAAPPPPEPPARPAWEASEPPEPPESSGPPRRRADQRIVIPVLIGLVSVTGAVVTWQSALASEKATDADRQALAETVQVSQAAADVEIVVQDAIVRFSEHAASLVNAGLLEADAERFRGLGNAAAADLAASQAVEERAVARRVLEGASVQLVDYVDAGAATPFFDSSRLRTDLLESVARDLQVDPDQTRADADELRDESQRLDGWIIALVGAVVLLTFGQISRRRGVRLGFLGAGAAVWVVASAMAFGG